MLDVVPMFLSAMPNYVIFKKVPNLHLRCDLWKDDNLLRTLILKGNKERFKGLDERCILLESKY